MKTTTIGNIIGLELSINSTDPKEVEMVKKMLGTNQYIYFNEYPNGHHPVFFERYPNLIPLSHQEE